MLPLRLKTSPTYPQSIPCAQRYVVGIIDRKELRDDDDQDGEAMLDPWTMRIRGYYLYIGDTSVPDTLAALQIVWRVLSALPNMGAFENPIKSRRLTPDLRSPT